MALLTQTGIHHRADMNARGQRIDPEPEPVAMRRLAHRRQKNDMAEARGLSLQDKVQQPLPP